MSKVTIGGQEYEVPPLKFKQLKIIWPKVKGTMAAIKTAQENTKPGEDIADAMFAAVDDAAFIIATAMQRTNPEHTPQWIEETLEANEVGGLAAAVTQLMLDSELMKMGKQEPAASE